MSVVVALGAGSARWAEHLTSSLEAIGIDQRAVTMGDDIDPASVEFVVMWNLTPEQLSAYPNLRGILMGGAGFDHLDLSSMPDVPIVRLIDPGMAHDIAAYVLVWTIYFQRDFDRFADAASRAEWSDKPRPRFTRDITVGIVGMGAIGAVVAEMCEQHGFSTLGWSRSNHDRSLLQFCEDVDVLVNLVPLSDATHGLIGSAELAALGDGVLINVGRGPTVDTEALIVALDGSLRGAVLDVFDTEPLPPDSPLWGRPDLVVTPHVAGRSDPVTATAVVAASIADLAAGRQPIGTIPRG